MSDVSAAGSTSSSGAAPLLVNGLVSGINTTQVIQALLQAYQAPITNLQGEQASLKAQAGDYRTLNADFQALQSAARALSTPSSWNLRSATTSDAAVASATAAPGALPGSLAFSVTRVAQANVVLSTGAVSSEAATVASGPSLLAATGTAALGLSGVAASGALSFGSHAISVTQSSAAAAVSGTAVSSTDISSGVNDTLDLEVSGSAYSLVLQPGTALSPTGLAAEVNAAATAAGAPITASVDSSGGLVVSTDSQGSAATISVTGGDAAASLGLTSGLAGTGTDAVVTVDGTATRLSSLDPGGSVSLAAPSGAITATLAAAPGTSGALVAIGNASAALVSTGNGSLSDVVSNLNAAGLGLSATAVREASGDYRLQVSADSTGLAGAVSIDSSTLDGGALGTLGTIIDAADAEVTVGGSSGYSLESSTDTFSNLMPGTSVTVSGTGSATVTVAPDATGEANAVSSLVAAANTALSDITKLAGYDADTETAGPLMGSAVIQNLEQSVLSSFSSSAGTSGLGSPAAVGITLNKDGTISFDQSTFEQAFSTSPTAVSALFSTGGSFSPSSPAYAGEVGLVYAGDSTVPGTYDVEISSSATEASDTGASLADGTVSAGETLEIASGGTSVSYATSAGQSLDAIAAGLNSLFSANGLGLSAVVQGGDQLAVQTSAYGSAATFSVSTSAPGAGTTGLGGPSAGVAVTYTGTDVAGTINGVAASGTGRVLVAPVDDPSLAGLSVSVTTTGISSLTDLGHFTYTPGLAESLSAVAGLASNASTGSLTSAIQGLTDQASGLNAQIANYQQLESSEQTLLTNQFAQMEQTLGTLKQESSELSSQIANLSGF